MGDFNINLMSNSNNVRLLSEIMHMNYHFPMILRLSRIIHKFFSLIDLSSDLLY